MLENESPQFLRILWEENLLGLAKVSRDGKWLAINPRLCEILEYTESELLHKTVQNLTHPDDVVDDREMSEKCLSGSIDSYIMSKRFITKTGKVVWIKLKASIVVIENNIRELFLSQITPINYVNDREWDKRKNPEDSIGITKFIKSNWKYLLGIVGAILLFSYQAVSEWQKMQLIIQQLQSAILELSNK